MAEVIRARCAIPEIGAETGDHVIIRPGHADARLAVVKRYGYQMLDRLRSEGRLNLDRPGLKVVP